MAMPKHFRQVLPPFANIFFDNRPVRIDRIIENDDISRTFSFFNEERGERCCSNIDLAQRCLLLCEKREGQ
jgi:alkylation response protein AidB-like acyl-CoA dehydrogenase